VKTRHLVDPELRVALDQLDGLDAEYTVDRLPTLRQMMVDMYAVAADSVPAVPEIERRDITVPGPEGAPDVRVLVYTHEQLGTGRPAYFYIHGGGFIMGSPEFSDAANRMLARELGCVVVAAGYRVAPETVFPGNVEDCYAALKWLHAHAAELGADPARIAIGGESAGGGLAAALALLARDRGEVPIIHQQLIYPMLDDRSPASKHPFTGEFGWTRERNRFGWACLLGEEPGGAEVSPYASPARAENLEGLPPTFIGVGSLDLFLEEDTTYALRLIEAGVPVEMHVYPGAFHGSDLVTEARVTKAHARDQLAALRAAFAR
jgi:acetyl esterase/lipase